MEHEWEDELYCVILAGPNGSGKSTIAKEIETPGEFINADHIEAALKREGNPNAGSIAAGKIAIKAINNKIETRKSFTYETTLSSHQSMNVIRSAKDHGYTVDLLFVCVNSTLLNVKRVQSRVEQGGHDIPIEAITRRYDKSFSNLSPALQLVDTALIYDNSGESPQLIAHVEDRMVIATNFEDGNELHERIFGILRDNFEITSDAKKPGPR
ncbi:zeta toxin family protein [Mesorhizobium sp. SP-1A]|uniref:zeta toxin family protein n=1 Tax=Mesorhizobium sp. SP-1A TaxID=3077840 RepID=UPI0028F6ED01|nr:zeta toxin family protein [Mesorhizobium sp. SP-1A]